ncbi:GumC family protein [Tichowtungia aerotolerans]|uniref:Uncharacterized protein n=1 Tax=Tichowtungia aerotolerans TaxID=2697043 RepID=A0A6P1M8L2_9BACT|nr:hypothetical protein [Tichowtungia aerotolerans]QHI70237.1 hypothetical protein GT409_12560 [Tichowtungia aerotolerans]
MRDKPEENLTFGQPREQLAEKERSDAPVQEETGSSPSRPQQEPDATPKTDAVKQNETSETNSFTPPSSASPRHSTEQAFRIKDQFEDLNTIHQTLGRKKAKPSNTPVLGAGLPDHSSDPATSIRRENDLQDFFRNLDIVKIMRGVYRRFWIALACAFGLMMILLSATRHLQGGFSYTAQAKIIYTNPSQKQIDSQGSSFMLRPLSEDTLLDMLLSPDNITSLEQFTGFEPLEQSISYDSQRKSDIITLQVNDMPDEKTAIQAVNKLAEIIISSNAKFYRDLASAAYEQYHTQRENVEKELKAATEAVENFQRKNELLELNTQYENYFSSKTAAADRLSVARVAHEGLLVRINNYEKMIADLPDEILDEAQEDNPLKRRISNAEAALLQARIQYAADNPKIQRQEKELEELRKMLQSGTFDETRERTYISNPLKGQLEGELMKLRSEEQVAAQQVAALQNDLDKLNAHFQKLPGLEKEYARLLEKRSTLDASYKQLKASEESAHATMTASLSDFRLFSSATSAEPGGSSLLGRVIPIAGFVFGFFGGIAIILLIELLDGKIRTLHQLEKAYDAPCLASIVEIPNFEQYDAYELLLPSTREISDRLNVLLRGKKAKMFGFASSLDDEGKSIISFNLARYYSSLNLRVLFVSFDTKSNPCLPDLADTAWPQMGLEDYLSDQAELSDMLLTVHGVDVVRVNQMRSDLLDLAKGPSMPRLRDLLCSSYDLIITEIPSVLDNPLAGTVSAFQDELIYVIASPVSDRKLVDAGLEFLEDRGLAPRALVFNKVNPYYLEDVRQQRVIRSLPDQRGLIAGLFDRVQKSKESAPEFMEPVPGESQEHTTEPEAPSFSQKTAPEEIKETPGFEEMSEEEELSFIEWMNKSKKHNQPSEEEPGTHEKRT